MTHFTSIFGLFDIVRRDQHGDIFFLRDLSQVDPNASAKSTFNHFPFILCLSYLKRKPNLLTSPSKWGPSLQWVRRELGVQACGSTLRQRKPFFVDLHSCSLSDDLLEVVEATPKRMSVSFLRCNTRKL